MCVHCVRPQVLPVLPGTECMGRDHVGKCACACGFLCVCVRVCVRVCVCVCV